MKSVADLATIIGVQFVGAEQHSLLTSVRLFMRLFMLEGPSAAQA
jgi:hypothetical protein